MVVLILRNILVNFLKKSLTWTNKITFFLKLALIGTLSHLSQNRQKSRDVSCLFSYGRISHPYWN